MWAQLKPGLWPLLVCLGAFGCGSPSDSTSPNRWEIFSGVLGKVTRELDLDHTLAVHPLLGEPDWGGGGAAVRMDVFNVSDTSVVKGFVDAHNAEYHLCTLDRLKNCDPRSDEVYVILSEHEELGERQVGVLAIVVDNRLPPGSRQYFVAHLQPRWGKWRVVSFKKTR